MLISIYALHAYKHVLSACLQAFVHCFLISMYAPRANREEAREEENAPVDGTCGDSLLRKSIVASE